MKHDSNANSFLSGGVAGIFAKTIVAPIDRIKIFYLVLTIIKVSFRKFSYKMFFSDIKYIYNHEGIIYFWRGNIPNVLRAFPYSGIVNYNKIMKNLINPFN
jgi:hypothetical protein